MRTVIRRVDRLQRLALFEAAARLGSFTAAAEEVGLSQPSVTRQVRALERSIGVELFHRSANRSALTNAGRDLLAAVDTGFATIEASLERISTPGDVLVLAAPPGFAQQLIVPHLDTFHDVLPERDLRLWIYDRHDELVGGNFDLAVRVGARDWPGYESVELFAECVVPVAAPTLAHSLGLTETSAAEQILAAPLLHMDADGRPWLSWSDWLAAFDLALTPGRRRIVLNNYPTVIQQAVAGRGVALGWRGIVDTLLADGLLVEVGAEVRSERSYHVSWPNDRTTAGGHPHDVDARRAAAAWLVDLRPV
jgi:DNA-binding transcriptional LysR family regulator